MYFARENWNIKVVASSFRKQWSVIFRGTSVLKSDLAEREMNGQRCDVCFLLTSNRLDLISGVLLQCHLVKKKVEAVRRPASGERWPSPPLCVQLTTFTPLTSTGYNLSRCWLTCQCGLGDRRLGEGWVRVGWGGAQGWECRKNNPPHPIIFSGSPSHSKAIVPSALKHANEAVCIYWSNNWKTLLEKLPWASALSSTTRKFKGHC